ncbi:hypothetical protein MRB53_037100 [Persea americana]|nr:hypothetical protein MRB53_037100 [Persea americana]
MLTCAQRWQQLKAQGVSETDPEFLKLKNILTALANHNMKRKAQMMQQQQQQQQQQQLQQQAGVTQNGSSALPHTQIVNGGGSTDGSGQQMGDASTGETTASSGADNSGHKNNPQPTGLGAQVMTDQQRLLLKNQMNAYKLLSRNAPLPSELQQALFAHYNARATTPKEVLEAAGKILDANAVPSLSEPPIAQRKGYESYISPYSYLDKQIPYASYAQRSKRPIIPSIMPAGIDVDRFREERETIIYNRLMARKAELEHLPAVIDSWDTSKSNTKQANGNLKLKALLEYKMLLLLPKQRALREKISRELVQADTLAMTANRSLYRRTKKQSLREARITEKLEKQQRDARETKDKKKHVDYLKAILDHADEVKKGAKEQQARIQRFGRLMVIQHQKYRKGGAEEDRTNGSAALTVSSTSSQPLSGHSSVRRQNGGARRTLPPEPEPEEDDDEDDGQKEKIDYYEVAHRIKETVVAQSSNLVGGTLKEYQIKGLQWMMSLFNNNLNGILADEMGLGKTIQTISLITYIIEKKNKSGPFLSSSRSVLSQTVSTSSTNGHPRSLASSTKDRQTLESKLRNQIRSGNFQVLLTTYEFIIKDRPILSKVKWLHMIVDEGHRMKNAGSKLSSTITQYYTTRFRLILTGTPLQNNLPELWALLNFVLPTSSSLSSPSKNGSTLLSLAPVHRRRWTSTKKRRFSSFVDCTRCCGPFLLRRLKKDVEKDLPDKQERVIKCSMSSLQAKLYKGLATENRLIVSDGKGGKTGMRGLSNMLMQMRKVCNHPFVFEAVEDQLNPERISNDLLWRTAGKFELLDRVLPKLQATGPSQITYMRLDGSTKSEERSDLLKDFNAPNSPYFCFLLSTRAGGLGLNLQTADTVIIFDSDWNPHQDLQAQDRAHRIGQKNEVRILRLITSNSVEEKILERAQYKLDMDGAVIQAGKFDNKSTNEEREAMLRVMLEAAEVTEDLEQEEMDDDELNTLMVRSEDELAIFQKMMRSAWRMMLMVARTRNIPDS